MPGGSVTVVFQTPSASFFMEMAFACHCVKSPASNTLNASGAVNAKVCLLSSLLFFEFVLFAMCFSFLFAFVHYSFHAEMVSAGSRTRLPWFNRLIPHEPRSRNWELPV